MTVEISRDAWRAASRHCMGASGEAECDGTSTDDPATRCEWTRETFIYDKSDGRFREYKTNKPVCVAAVKGARGASDIKIRA